MATKHKTTPSRSTRKITVPVTITVRLTPKKRSSGTPKKRSR